MIFGASLATLVPSFEEARSNNSEEIKIEWSQTLDR